MKRLLLLALTAGLLSPIAVNAQTVWLIYFVPVRTKTNAKHQNVAITMDKIPQESMEQCNSNGKELKELYSSIEWASRDMKWKCIYGK